MKAIVVESDQTLVWREQPIPEPGPDEVRIKVHATAINRADLMQRRGFYPPPPGASQVLGLECAGEIDKVGEGSRWQVGDRVCALLTGGGYAEYAVVHAGSVLPNPTGFSYVHGASLPEVFATAWLNLFMEANLQPGEKVVIHAGASGVGTAAIQLCESFGNPSFVTAGTNEKIDRCIELGASDGSNRHEGPFLDKAKAFAGASGVDVILDPIGAAYLKDNLDLLGLDGRLVLIGLMGGGTAEIQLPTLLGKRLRVIGSTLRARTVEAKAKIMASMLENIWPKLESAEIRPIVDTVMPVQEAGAAHDLVASDKTFGKVVLTLD